MQEQSSRFRNNFRRENRDFDFYLEKSRFRKRDWGFRKNAPGFRKRSGVFCVFKQPFLKIFVYLLNVEFNNFLAMSFKRISIDLPERFLFAQIVIVFTVILLVIL